MISRGVSLNSLRTRRSIFSSEITAVPKVSTRTETGSAKVTALAEYPGKGRATGGVRAHRFLKGEDTLLIAAIGPAPVVAGAASGSPVELPSVRGRRDGSGTPVAQPVTMLSGRGGHSPEPTDSGVQSLFDEE